MLWHITSYVKGIYRFKIEELIKKYGAEGDINEAEGVRH
jgi:hypothetical protein